MPLLDAVGSAVMETVRDGEVVELRDDALWRNGEKLAAGELLTADEVDQRMEEARLRIGTELRSFARNTLEYIDKEAERTLRAARAAAARDEVPRSPRARRRARSRLQARSRARCARTSASTGPCSSRSTVAPTR